MASSQVPILASSYSKRLASMPCLHAQYAARMEYDQTLIFFSTSGVLDYALNLSISLSAGKETKWDSHSNGE